MGTPADPTSQILIKLGEMSAQLAVMDERLKAVPDHESRLRAIEVLQEPDHEPRIRSLEQFRWKITGIAIAAGAVSGVAGSLLSHVTLH